MAPVKVFGPVVSSNGALAVLRVDEVEIEAVNMEFYRHLRGQGPQAPPT